MISEDIQQQILDKLSKGLKICEAPYAELAEEVGVSEAELLEFIKQSVDAGVVKRLGMVVNHHKAGFVANAMVVWNISDDDVDRVGDLLGQQDEVTLCYQRPRRLPEWPYNLFTMIHGKSRAKVLDDIQNIAVRCDLEEYPKDILFSSKKFKQTGARYYARVNRNG